MMRLILILFVLLFAFSPGGQTLAQGEPPVVYGVLFYSPTCPHCHLVIENDWPRMQAEFGDQFELLFINVQTPGGEALFRAAYNAPHLDVDSLGVPTMIIGDVVMVGSVEIPAVAFDLIRQGIASGGIGLPDIPGLREAYEAYTAQESGGAAPERDESTAIGAGEESGGGVAQAIAIGVLAILAATLVTVLVPGLMSMRSGVKSLSGGFIGTVTRYAAPLTAALGVVAGLTLMGEAISTPVVFLLALVVVGALAAVVFGLWKPQPGVRQQRSLQPDWLIPVTAISGLAAAAYLAYIELTQAEAICGLVGECNVVQQSEYARLFGLLPIGLIGVFGYLAILVLWFVGYRTTSRHALTARSLLLAATSFGVAFSIYLTFLEIFVIGAVCMWCITSALVMALLLWLAASDGWGAILQLRRPASTRTA